MKRILAACTALLSLSAAATTLNPIQLLNPAGSTSGQVISSTGPTTAPAWATVTLSGLGGMPITGGTFTGPVMGPTPATTDASTKLATTSMVNSAFSSPPVSIGGGTPTSGSFTSLSAPSGLNNTPIGLASPQPATVTNLTASGTVSGSGFTALLAPYATVAQATTALAATGGSINGVTVGLTTPAAGKVTTLVATGLITPTSTIGIKGTATNDSPQAGSVGEAPTASVTTSTAITINTATNLVSLPLTAGDWEVTANCAYTSGTTTTQVLCGISQTSATMPLLPFIAQNAASSGTSWVTGQVFTQVPPSTIVQLAASGTVYLVGFVSGSGSPTFQATIHARRPR